MLCGCSSFLAGVEKNSGSVRLRVDFPKSDMSTEKNKLFKKQGCKECRKGLHCTRNLLLFLLDIDPVTDQTEKAPLIKSHLHYTDVAHDV